MSDDKLFKAGNNTMVRFFEEADKNNFVSEQKGKPCFDTVLMAEIITPGSTESAPTVEIRRTFTEEFKPAEGHGFEKVDKRFVRTSQYAERYKDQLEAYDKQNGKCAVDGLPLDKWPVIDAGVSKQLRARNIHTVEQLAAVPDSSLDNLGTGGRRLREQAKAYINARQFGLPVAEQTAETETLKEKVAGLEKQVEELKAINAELQAKVEAKPEGGEAKDNSKEVV